jgi:hypothetical protein
MKKIEVVITPSGEVTVETSGFKGKACQDVTAQLNRALGSVVSETKKPEFYQVAAGELKARG